MKSMFVFRQQYILLGPLPMGLLQTHMEVICSNSSAGKEIRGGGWPWDLGAGNQFEKLGLDGVYVFRGAGNWGFCEKWH